MIARALIAVIVAALMLAVGAYAVLTLRHANVLDVFSLILMRDGATLCSVLAIGAAVSGAVALMAAFGAFFDDDDDDGPGRRRSGSKAAPVLFLLLAFGLLWAALACADRLEAQSVRIKIVQLPAPMPPAVAEPVEAPLAESSPTPPPVAVRDTELDWQYMYPLMRDAGPVDSAAMGAALDRLFPMDDPYSDVRSLLCNKAWVAVTGAASEEGPRERNLRRARVRAGRVAERIDGWLSRHADECPRPILLAIDLGQHVDTGASLAGAGRQTGYQRRLFIVSRGASPGEAMTAASAELEVRNFLSTQPSTLLGSRAYSPPPNVYAPLD